MKKNSFTRDLQTCGIIVLLILVALFVLAMAGLLVYGVLFQFY